MKKCYIVLLFAIFLSGCAPEETFETISDELIQAVMAQPREVSVRLPEDAAAPVLASDAEQVYVCESYEIILETLSSGDLNASVQTISGYEKDNLTIVETGQEEITRYEFVWVSAGENGDRLGRAVILDDGNYHYCLSAIRDAGGEKGDKTVVWNDVFSSFTLL